MSQNASLVAQRYFDAWNRRDSAAILATIAENGTYTDPLTPGPLTGAAIGAYAEGLWAAFPDLSFDVASMTESATGLVCVQWLMKGTNAGSLNGLPPTGKAVAVPGADFIQVDGDAIRSVQGYFDSAAVPRALGLDVIVQPRAIGPFGYGTSVRVTNGSTATPGAFSVTCLEARTDAEKNAVRESSRKIAMELLTKPGFISFVGVTVGERMMTITAWESPDVVTPLMKGGEHRTAVGRFFGPELARGAHTGVWTPARLNPRWIRCEACSAMVKSDQPGGTCGCGASLPPPVQYW
jgi:steroid delta-isomerase-like uncharacterized protein